MLVYFKKIVRDAVAVIKGMRVTLKTMLKPSITVQYPKERLEVSPHYRGVLDFNKETCTSCNLCAKACPSECISMEPQVNEQGKRIAKVKWYSINFAKCNYCALCQEACPTKPKKSVFHTGTYNLLFDSRSEMIKTWRNAT